MGKDLAKGHNQSTRIIILYLARLQIEDSDLGGSVLDVDGET